MALDREWIFQHGISEQHATITSLSTAYIARSICSVVMGYGESGLPGQGGQPGRLGVPSRQGDRQGGQGDEGSQVGQTDEMTF